MKFYYSRSNRLVPIQIPADLTDVLFVVYPDDGTSIYSTSNGNCQSIQWS